MAKSKYLIKDLIPQFRIAAKARNDLNDAGLTDNAGAIHSAMRVLSFIAGRLNYPAVGHPNNLRNYDDAEYSQAARKARKRGEKVVIEHVSPQVAFTQKAIDKVTSGATDKQLIRYVKQHYRLVLLTPEEQKHLNKMNRSRMTRDRLGEAGIRIVRRAKRVKR